MFYKHYFMSGDTFGEEPVRWSISMSFRKGTPVSKVFYRMKRAVHKILPEHEYNDINPIIFNRVY